VAANPERVKELGLLGGMFDPVHFGHLNITLSSLEKLQLDEIHLLPCGQPVHKSELFTSSKHRLAMLEIVANENPAISIDDRECRSREPSYTLKSLQAIRHENPDARLYYILGQDAFNAFDTWYCWQEIFSLVHIIVTGRPGYEFNFSAILQKEFEERKVDSVAALKTFSEGKILITEFEMLDISSSLIRENIQHEKKLNGLLPESIINYINKQQLYTREVAS
jgi:nicotinate-nucleotide adenylyltransferase